MCNTVTFINKICGSVLLEELITYTMHMVGSVGNQVRPAHDATR
jgi:hypothetical protein